MNVILLSGGSGTRLWPLSNDARSKQFLKVFKTADGGRESMIQRNYRMIKDADPDATVTVAAPQIQVGEIRNHLGDNVDISVEPCRRDTFPAIALAVLYLKDVRKVAADEAIVVCPVDPYAEKGYFETLSMLSKECLTNGANLTLMGIKPDCPSEKYGYIMPDGTFKEKPTKALAEEFIAKGALWNGGVFAFRAGYMYDKIAGLCGTVSYRELYDGYAEQRKISFDYAVAEHEKSIKQITYDGAWLDLGTWNALTGIMEDPVKGNASAVEGCENTHVINELGMPMLVLGINNAAVVATQDGILVADKEKADKLKEYVPKQRPMFEKRFWGEYKVLEMDKRADGYHSLTKHLVIKPGHHISYQKHHCRYEIWTAIEGTGTLIIDGEKRTFARGDSVHIAPEVMHAIRAETELHIIEVQLGSVLTEEDIERTELDWDKV